MNFANEDFRLMIERSHFRISHLLKPGNWIPIAILLLSLVIRLWLLDLKPAHFDEGINGHFVIQMWKDGFYKYDPTNFHGPLYFYLLQLSELFFGRGVFAFRLTAVLASVTAIGFTLAHRRFFGSAALWAALVLTLSPACVFYARYAIHEWLFVALQVVFSYGFFLYREEKSRKAVALMTLGFFGTFATKETFFVFFGTVVIAIYVDHLFERFRTASVVKSKLSKREKKARQKHEQPENLTTAHRLVDENIASPADTFSIVAIGFLAVLAIFSGFFVHTVGLIDMVRALMFWTKTGTAHSGHDKAFTYWFTLMWRYEWPMLIGLAFTPVTYFLAKRPSDKNERLMILIAFGTWLAYSLIPYKTPWLILNPLWPLAFVFGFGILHAKALAQKLQLSAVRYVVPILAIFTLGVSGHQMRNLVFINFVNPTEPYVYVQSTMQFKNAMDWITARVKEAPDDLNMRLLVLNRDTWPMPWTLSQYPNLAWGSASDANLNDAAVVMIDADDRQKLEARLKGTYFVQPFQIRDAYNNGWAYFEVNRFRGILPTDSLTFTGAVSTNDDSKNGNAEVAK